MIARLKDRTKAHLFREVKDFRKGYFVADAYVSRCGTVVVPVDAKDEHLVEETAITCITCDDLEERDRVHDEVMEIVAKRVRRESPPTC